MNTLKTRILSIAKWFWQQKFVLISGLFFLVLVIVSIYIGVLWFQINRTEKIRDELLKISEIATTDQGQSVRAEYPARILYDGPAREVKVTRLATSTLSLPLTLTLHLEEGFTLSGTNHLPSFIDHQLVFSPTEETVQSITFHVSNARRIEDIDLSIQTLTLTPLTPPLVLSIEVEGAQRSVHRAFINSTINEKSPLIIGLSALISVIAFGFNFIQQQYRERKEREEKQFQERKEQEEKQRKIEEKLKREQLSQVQFGKIREALIKANAAQARHELGVLLESKENLREFILTDDIDYIKELIQIAQDNTPNLVEFMRTARWPEETAGALIAQGTNVLQVQERRNLINAINIFLSSRQQELSEKKQQDLRNVITKWEENLKIDRNTPWKITYPKPQPQKENSHISKILEGYSPFNHRCAEYDLNFLLHDTGGFWSEHLVYKQIINSAMPQVIFGVEGCGKTAFAQALSQRLDDPRGDLAGILPVYISGQLNLTEIRQFISQSLLEFICASPFTLSGLGNYEQHLLARQLCTTLDHDTIARVLVEGAKRQQPLKITDPEKLELWRTETLLQLNMFEKILEQNKMASWIETSNISVLELDFIVVSMDVNNGEINYIREILSLLHQWTSYKLIVKLFLPQTTADKLMGNTTHLDFIPLTWTEIQLKEMATWRFERTTTLLGNSPSLDNPPFHGSIEDIFDNIDLYSQFIRYSQGNPRRLAKLWNYLFDDHLKNTPDQFTFSAENLKGAMKRLK